ncbi:MAG: T9SS type A sorting domain-containing protein, partial [Bacteroidales bacterium]|nr:T9SS type A sorting domain-containing protein [Bacteroidales bacterium]
GNLLWEKVIKNYGPEPLFYLNDEGYDLYVDDNGYIYVASTIMYNNFSKTGALTKLSPQGDIMYIRHYEPTGRGEHQSAITYLNSVKPTPDGGLIMGGYTYDSYYTPTEFGDYFQQPWLVKTDMDGLDGLCYTELPELDFDIFIPDTVCNLDTIDCVVNISGPSAPYRLDFSTGQVIDSIYYPDTYVPYDFGIDRPISSEYLYEYSDYITEATLKKNTTWEDIIARHYNIRTPRDPGEHQLAITLSDYYGNTKTIYKDIYVNPCHDLAVDENDNIMLSVYPNPAKENIVVEGENIAEIQICNLLGEVMYEIGKVAPRHDYTISTEGMGAGSYFVRIRMADGKVVTKKIVVIK